MMKTKILLFAMACAFTVQASAQSGSVKYNDFVVTNPSNIKQGVLANGFRYYLCDNGVPVNKLEMRLIQKSGTDDEGDSNHGAGLSLGAGLQLQRFKLHVAYAKYHVSASSILVNVSYSL